MSRVIVIGAGLGGLSAAIRLASAGFQVTVLEQQPEVGGKLQRVSLGEYRFDRGPSTITMRHAFERVFQTAGRRMEDYLSLYTLPQGVRNVFADGNVVDLTNDQEAVESQIAVYSVADALAYKHFMAESGALYRLADKLFFNRLLLSWRDKADPRLMAGLLRVRPFTSLNKLLRRYFRHPHTLALFGRYATYVGSSPSQAPAIFGLLPHLETALGIHGVRGGTYQIASAFRKLAEELGVEIRTSVRVDRILSKGGTVTGVETAGGDLPADIVIGNGDVLSMHNELLGTQAEARLSRAKVAGYEPSLSGFVILAGVRKMFPDLLHHTVFYPEDYGSEFDDIFRQRIAPRNPALYVCHSGHSENNVAPIGGSNLFILANAPYLSEAWDWSQETDGYRDRMLTKLEQRGLSGLQRKTEVMETYSPLQLQRDTSAYQGSIYGISSNSAKQTFFRPSNEGKLKGLWFAGGTTHPGGGTPMVTLSGQLVAEHIISSRGRG